MNESFHVFLSHNSKDKPTVRQLAQALQARGLKVWLDEEQLVPGRPWQEALEAVIQTIRTAAVLVGKDGLGPWENPEMRACLSEFVNRQLPVIPVLLPGTPVKPEELSLFLRAFTWVDLRGGLTDDGLDQLEWGIRGVKPGKVDLPKKPRVSKPVGSSQSEPWMNLESELDAFKKIATGEDTQTRLILVTGDGGMGKSHLLGLYKQVADENNLDVLPFSLSPQISVENCIGQIVVRFGCERFHCYDEFLINYPHKPLPPAEEEAWQRNLTRQFFKDLGNYISASPIAIFFDQYEKADPIFKNWLADIFLPYISVRYPIIVVIAGRESIEPPPSAKGCPPFPLKGVNVHWYRRYVEDCKVELDSKLIDEFHKLLHGRPKEFVEYVKTQLLQGAVQ